MDTDSVLKLDLAELRKQVEIEHSAIINAPRVESVGYVNRCHFCGQLVRTGSHERPLHRRDPESGELIHDRFRGECCGG